LRDIPAERVICIIASSQYQAGIYKAEKEVCNTNKEVRVCYVKAVYFDLKACCDEFVQGVELLEQSAIAEAVDCFYRACQRATPADPYFFKYSACYGLAVLLDGDVRGLDICRLAARKSPLDADVALSLVRAEAFAANRKAAINTLEQYLRLQSGHHGLRAMQQKLGVRGRKPVPFLSRNHCLNVALGKWLRRKKLIVRFFNML
jgi:hypothetical protein